MADLTDCAEAVLLNLGYTVARNTPYAGGFTTRYYGRPENGVHALQIEGNRALYMDEGTLQPHAGADRLREDLSQVLEHVAATSPIARTPEAAE